MDSFKIDVLDKKGCTTEIKVEIPPEKVKEETESVFVDIQKNASINGFRKGHAPMDFVKREYEKTALDKAIRNLMSDSVEKIIKEKEFHPIVSPIIEPLDYQEGKPLSFKMKVEQSPEFEVKDYKKIKVTKKVKKITNKEIDDVVKNLQDRQATLEDAGDVVIEPHHFLVADYEGTIDGKKMDKPAMDQIIDLSHKSLPEGFASGLVGLKAGDSKTIDTKFEDKKATFNIKVKSIKKKIVKEIDDEFAKDMGHENINQLREKIKEELVKAEEEKTRQEMENQIVESLLKSNNFDIPESLVEDEINRSIEKTKQYLVSNRSFNEEEFKKSIPAMRDKYKVEAEKTVRVSFILSRIAKDENVDVTLEEINKKIEEMSGGDKKVSENYGKYHDYISLQIKERKLFDLLLNNAKIKEV
ncbi:MAG TPA: trigger factor [Elusimicrobia bacterium]|nr:trigger factor [Elusimicrobiota bacterium]